VYLFSGGIKNQEMKEQGEEEGAEVTSTEAESLESKLDEKTKLADEYLSRLKYLQADFENYKKRVVREREQYEMCATETLIQNLLPIIDTLECAIASASNNTAFEEGIALIHKDLITVLAKEGLKPIAAVGEKFDPYKHEVIMTVTDDDHLEDTILEVFEKGYMLGSKVIRTSKVKVSKLKE